MKVFGGLPRFVWVLLGLLAISAGILSLGHQDLRAKPSVLSYDPSGTSAFASLLEKRGYRVRIDTRSHPKLEANEVAFAFHVTGIPVFFQDPDTPENPELQGFLDLVKGGGRAVLASVPYEFFNESRNLLHGQPRTINLGAADKKLVLFAGTANAEEDKSGVVADSPSVALWVGDDGHVVVRASQVGKGRLLEATDGIFLTNRFIDRSQDADAALRLISLAAKPGETIVFTESTVGNVEDPGLMEAIGPWAIAGWRQVLFLVAVVIYTLSKRFGIPDESRSKQTGSRELVDGLADTYYRTRQTKAAMGAALERCDQILRNALRLPRDYSRGDRDELLPTSLRMALTRLRAAYEMDKKPSPDEALALISTAQRETEEFVKGTRSTLIGRG